jgi:DNA-binding GntR family transcriptional regulator
MVQLADSIRPVDVTTAVGPQLMRALRDRIISNELAPGMRLSEADVAASFGVSRQPVRETFIKLAEEGLVEVRPQRGTFVRKISTGAVMDARFVREAIEADIVKLVAEDADTALVQSLTRLLDAQRKVALDDPRSFVPLDDAFHRTLAEAAGKANAWRVIEGMKSQMDRVRQLSTVQFPMARLIDQHSEIVRAIAAHDPAAAEAAMREHLRAILLDLPLIRQGLPEYFDDPGPLPVQPVWK